MSTPLSGRVVPSWSGPVVGSSSLSGEPGFPCRGRVVPSWSGPVVGSSSLSGEPGLTVASPSDRHRWALPSRGRVVPSWSGPVVGSSGVSGEPGLTGASAADRLRGAISHAPRTPQGPGGRPRRSIRRGPRLTSAGLRRCASVCGVSPSGPPGSLCFATSISWGTATNDGDCSDAPAASRRWLPQAAPRGARREPQASRGVPRGALPQPNHRDGSSGGVRRTVTAVLSVRTLPWPGGCGGDGVVPREMARRCKRKPRAFGQPQPATRVRPQRTHPPPDGVVPREMARRTTSRWERRSTSTPDGGPTRKDPPTPDGVVPRRIARRCKRKTGVQSQPQPATGGRPRRTHPPPTESRHDKRTSGGEGQPRLWSEGPDQEGTEDPRMGHEH